MNDGTVFLNTVVIIPPNRKSESYNFFKLLPSGKVDSSFILSDLYYTYGFEFFDDHTLYAVGDKGLFRFIKSAEKRYFYYNPLPDKMPVNSGNSILSFKTNIKPIKIEVTGNAMLQSDSSITFLPKTGMVNIIFKDENGKILAQQQIELIKTIPFFTYTHPNLFDSSPPYEFKAQSSSGLPVKINAYGKEFIGSMPIDLSMGPYVKINLKSEGNEQYETIEETLYFVIQSPLSGEPVLTEKDLVCYPNPTIDELYIKINNLSINSFRLVNVKGNEIPVKAEMIGDQYKLSFANIPQGVYILLAQSGQIQVSRKIVIE